MMQMSIDIADAIQEVLNVRGHDACAPPVPEDLDQRLPLTRVRSIGGSRSQVVLDTFNVHLDTWAVTPADAIAEANSVAALLAEQEGQTLGGVQCYHMVIGGLPHEDKDPDRPDLPMASFMAQVSVRTINA